MAKKQTFADKSKGKEKSSKSNVKFVKSMKSEKGSYKFQEKFVQLDDLNQVTSLK